MTEKSRLARLTSLDEPTDGDWMDTALEIGAGFTPLQYPQAARDFERARRADDVLGMGLAGLAAIPVAGGIAKAAGKLRKIKYYHGGLPENATLEHIDINRLGTQQNKKGQTYGGFYTATEKSRPWAEQYAAKRNNVLHEITLKNDARIQQTDEVIDRLSKDVRDSLAKMYDAIVGKDVLGREQMVLLNKDAVSSFKRVPIKSVKKASGGMIENTTHDRKTI